MPGLMLQQRPDPRLRPWVSHYWFSRGGAATHVILPDGCVDLVVASSERASTVWVYGTATQRTTLSTDPAKRYLGVRFLPGQARHFLTMSAGELTDSAEQVSGQDALGLAGAPWCAAGARDVFQGLDALLLGVLARRTPRRLALDRVLQRLHDTPHGSLAALAADSGLSRRQLERQCRTHVGVAPAQFAMIRRCHRVLSALSQAPAGLSLVTLAAVTGYADQSHMTRELRRFTGLTPGALLRDGAGEDVAFVLADGAAASSH
jgi:AraC-like DNA-binding protein